MTTLTYFKGPPRTIKTALFNKKDCKDCKYYSMGKCTLFICLNNEYKVVNCDAEKIRKREMLCGPDAKYFKNK